MVYMHKLTEGNAEISKSVSHHSGDKTVSYKTVDGKEIGMSFYYPENYSNKKKYPTFVFIHGGGFGGHKIFDDQSGWAGDYLGYLARYYSYKGFIGISIDYRLASRDRQQEGYQIIDCYDDCNDAMDYILDNSESIGIDTKNVFILGESAGGHLAGLVTTKYKRQGFGFKASFLINPITDLVGDERWNKSVPQRSDNPALARLDKGDYAEYLSPLYNISGETCPVVLIHGATDGVVPPVHSERFYEKMAEYSRECELHIIEKTNHAFLLAEYTDNLAACKVGIGIIDKYIEKKSAVI